MTHHPREDGSTHQPRYPGAGEDTAAPARTALTARQRRTRVLVIAIVIALALVILLLHVTGAMPAGTGH